MNILRANIVSEQGRNLRTMIPPRSSREILFIPITSLMPLTLFTPKSLAKRCIFVVNVVYYEQNHVMLYNGGLEAQWIEHEETIAEY